MTNLNTFTSDVDDTILRDKGIAIAHKDNLYGDSFFQIETVNPAQFTALNTKKRHKVLLIGGFILVSISLFASFLMGSLFGSQIQITNANEPEVLGVSENLYQD